MEGAFAWLDRLFSYLGQFVPRPYLVSWTHRGVRYRRGGKPVLVEPGFRWYWPLTTSVTTINITLAADEFQAHVYTTKDGKPVVLAFTMVYWVHDPVLAHSTCDDYRQTIGELGESVLSPIVASQTFQQLLDGLALDKDRKGLNALFTKAARIMVRQFGIKVKYCRVHTFAGSRVLKLFQEGK